MSNTFERVFIIGGTGNVGSKTVNDLLAKNISVTLYARQPEKVKTLFSNNSLVSVVQGDYNDLTPLKEGLKGHTRLFLLIADLLNMDKLKKQISSWAYDAGVQQVVDVSSLWVSFPWRTTIIGAQHEKAEKAILGLPNRASYVTLRPGRFMSNLFFFDDPKGDFVYDTLSEDTRQGWISPNDIGAIAAVVLSDPIEKHGDSVYEISGDVATPAQRAEYLTRILGRKFTYKRISTKERYDALMSTGHFVHPFAYTLATGLSSFDLQYHRISDGISILLGREPQTLESYIAENKYKF